MAPKANSIALTLLKLTISTALLYFVFQRTGTRNIFSTFASLSISAFVAATFLNIFAQFLSTLRWKLLLPGGLGTGRLFSLYMIGSFFNTLLPGIIGGDAVKGVYLYRATGNSALSLASVFMDRYIGFVALITICAVSFIFGYGFFHGSPVAWMVPAAIFSFLGGSLLFFRLRLGQGIHIIAGLYEYFSIYRHRTGVISKALILSFFVQLAGITSVYILALGFGVQVPYLAFLIFVPLIVLVSMLPVSISGLGVREGAFVLFFSFAGVKADSATAISLAWFLTSTVGSLIGLIEYIRYKKEKIELKPEKMG